MSKAKAPIMSTAGAVPVRNDKGMPILEIDCMNIILLLFRLCGIVKICNRVAHIVLYFYSLKNNLIMN